MINRKLKPLSLALFAALAIGAAVTSSATAESSFKFKSNTFDPKLTASQHGSNVDVFTSDSGTVSCTSVTYSGVQSGTETSEMELEPTYGGCTGLGFIGVSIDSNGCKYRFTPGTKDGSSFEGGIHINCPTKPMAITFPFGCTTTLPTQNPSGTVTFTNLGVGHTQEYTVDLNLTGTKYEEHDPDDFPCVGDTEPVTNGTYSGALLVTGENASKQHIGIFVG